MRTPLTTYLSSYPKKTITIFELESMIPDSIDYSQFSQTVLFLEKEGVISPIKSQGPYYLNPSLSNAYRIHKNELLQISYEEIRKKQLSLHPAIQLTSYFSLPEEIWRNDQEKLEQLHQYVTRHGFPCSEVPSSERSYEICGDEKWISQGGGKELLERVGLYQAMRIVPVAEPLMFSINPAQIQKPTHQHLIVENKTTYDALSIVLADSPFTTLIYGAGKSFLNSILYLEKQLNLTDIPHTLYYFGDLDLEGINIWYSLNKRREAKPALPFYEALLQKPYTTGKENHTKNKEAFASFISCFPPHQQRQIEALFQYGGYYPQEALKGEELRRIWRSAWTDCC